MKFMTIVVLIVENIDLSNGYSTGAPNSTCDSMLPKHPGSPQTDSVPYRLTAFRPWIRAGDTLTLQLSFIGKSKFKGFLVQAYEYGTNRRIGEFVGKSRLH